MSQPRCARRRISTFSATLKSPSMHTRLHPQMHVHVVYTLFRSTMHLFCANIDGLCVVTFCSVFAVKRNRDSRPSSPVQSDTEFEVRKKTQKNDEDAESEESHPQSWRWGELPTPPMETPMSSHKNSVNNASLTGTDLGNVSVVSGTATSTSANDREYLFL